MTGLGVDLAGVVDRAGRGLGQRPPHVAGGGELVPGLEQLALRAHAEDLDHREIVVLVGSARECQRHV